MFNAANTIRVLSQNPKNSRLTFVGSDSWFGFSTDPQLFAEGRFNLSVLQGTAEHRQTGI